MSSFTKVPIRTSTIRLPVRGRSLVLGMRFSSPERWWRAAAAVASAGLAGWAVASSARLGIRPGASPGLPLIARIALIGVAVLIGACFAVLIMRTHLTVDDDGLADHRLVRVVRIPWRQIDRFEVRRPGGLWGGYCVAAVCGDGAEIDLMSTRAYSRIPSARHLDELHRICRTLDETASHR